MPINVFTGQSLPPGMMAPVYTTDLDNNDIVYGGNPGYMTRILTYAVLSGAARDAGNSPTDTLRQGLILGKVTASQKWAQFDNAASDGTQYARGILLSWGQQTQMDGANQDRFMANILVGGTVNPLSLCLASSSSYGLARISVGLTVRKHLFFNIEFSDDFERDLGAPLATRLTLLP